MKARQTWNRAVYAAVASAAIAVSLIGCGDDGDDAPTGRGAGVTTTAGPIVTGAPEDAPSYVDQNTNYNVHFDGASARVVENVCEGRQNICRRRGPNNIASAIMKQNGLSYTPITVVVQKRTHNASIDGVGWKIRPSHLQDSGVITDIDSSLMSTASTLSFVVRAPCQVSVELGDEDEILKNRFTYWAFSNLIIAINPPESTWPQQKPTVQVDPSSGDVTCTSSVAGRSCIVGQADGDCSILEVASNTDLYFTDQVAMSYRWGDGCGEDPKRIRLQSDSSVFLDPSVVVFARVVSQEARTGVYGYGILSNFYMKGVKRKGEVAGVVALRDSANVYGVILMDSTYRNIVVGGSSTVAWTKSFAWETETDGVELGGTGCHVHDNFLKVNDDVLKAFMRDTTFENNVIWHQTIGRAVMLSWGNEGENKHDLTGTTQVLHTSIIHDYRAFESYSFNANRPETVARQAKLVFWGTLVGAQHSMDNQLGTSSSPILIKHLRVESRVGILFGISTGYHQLNGDAVWQDSNGCGGDVNLKIEDLDLSRVYSYAYDSFAGGCKTDYRITSIQNAECLCTTARACGEGSRCSVSMRFSNVIDSQVSGVPALADAIYEGHELQLTGLSGQQLLI